MVTIPAQGSQQQVSQSPATQPTQNAGTQAQGIAELRMLVNLMAQTLTKVGATTEPGQALNKCITNLAKFVPPGNPAPAAEMNAVDDLQRRQQQAGPAIAAMRGRAA